MEEPSSVEHELNLLSTNYNSAVVRSKLSSIYCISQTNDNHIQLLSQNAYRFKRLARVHGLPKGIIEGILQLLQESNHVVSHSIKLTLAQALKHSARNQGSADKCIDIPELVKALKQTQFEDKINTELAFYLARLIENEDEPNCVVNILVDIDDCFKNISSEARELLSSQLNRVKNPKLNSRYGKIQDYKVRYNLAIAKAETVCNTTNTVQSYVRKHNKPEKGGINIWRMEKAARTKQQTIEQCFDAETLPPAVRCQESAVSWLNDSYANVKAILERARSGKPISDYDKDDYLVKNFTQPEFSFLTELFSSQEDLFYETTKMIAEIFRIISKRQTLTSKAINEILKGLTNHSSRIKCPLKQLEVKRCLIEAAYFSLIRGRIYVSPEIYQRISTYLNHPDSDMSSWSFRILCCLGQTEDIYCYREIFEKAFFHVDRIDEIQIAVIYISRQAANKTRCEELFTPSKLNLLSLIACSLLNSWGHESTILRGFAILNCYLQYKFTMGLGKDTCGMLGFFLNNTRATKDSKLEVLKCLFLSSLKPSNQLIPKDAIKSILKCIEDSDTHISNYALIVLHAISENQNISVASKISKMLLSPIVVAVKDNEIYFTLVCDDPDSKVNVISALACQIILHYVRRGHGCSKQTLEHLSKALSTCTDEQTKIYAAECLYHISLTQILGDKFLSKLKKHITHRIPDVRTYCTIVYIRGLQRNKAVVYHKDFNSIPELFAFDSFTLGDEDFTHMINTAILDIVYHNLSRFGSESSKSKNIFTLIGSILMSESEYHTKIKYILTVYEDCKLLTIMNDKENKPEKKSRSETDFATELYDSILKREPVPQDVFVNFITQMFSCQESAKVKYILNSLINNLSYSMLHLQKLDRLFQTLNFQSSAIEVLTKYSENPGNLLPAETIFVLENVLGEENLQSIALRVLSNAILNGQSVSETTIKIFIDDLFYSDDAVKRSNSGRILEAAESNQDLCDTNFVVVEMERAGVIAGDGVHSENDARMALVFIEKCVRGGSKLSLSNFEVLHKCLCNPGLSDISLSILQYASENRQNIPDNTVSTLVSSFNELLPSFGLPAYINFILSVLRNNQILPDCLEVNLCDMLGEESVDSKLVKNIFLIFQIEAQRGHTFSEFTSLALIRRFIAMQHELECINAEVVSLILKLMKASKISEIVCKGLVEIFVCLLQAENKLTGKLSLLGLGSLCESNAYVLAENQISEIIESSINFEADKESELVISRILEQYKLTDNQTTKMKILKLNNVPDEEFLLELKKSMYTTTEPFPESICGRLNRLLETNLCVNVKTTILHLILEKNYIPEETLEIIAQFYPDPENEKIEKMCETIFKLAASSGNLVSARVITACCNNIEILKLIYKNQPLSDDLQNKIRISDKLNTEGYQFSLEDIRDAISTAAFTCETLKQIIVRLNSITKDNINEIKCFGDIFALILKKEHCLSNDVCNILADNYEQISVHLENCIVNKYAPKELLDSYTLLLRNGCGKKITAVSCALTDLCSGDSFEVSLSLLKCIVELANKCPLPEEMICFLITNLKSENFIIRRLSFKGMRTMDEKYSSKSPEFQNFCKQLTVNINTVMNITNNDIVEDDLDFLETVTSLNYLNLEILKHIPTQSWKKELLFSDLLAKFCVSNSEWFQYYYNWKEVEEFYGRKYSIEQCDQVLGKLSEIVAEYETVVTFPQIMETFSALKSLAQTDVSNIFSKFRNNCLQRLKQQWYVDLITSKLTPELANRTSEANKLRIASEMANDYYFTSALQLVSILKCIDDIQLFRNILIKMKDTENFTPQFNEGDCFTLQELNLHLNKNYLMNLFTKEACTNNATEKILSKIIAAGTSFEVLKSLFASFEPEKSKQNSVDLSNILKIVNDYNIMKPVEFSRFMFQLKSKNPDDLIYTANQLVIKTFVNSENQRNLQELITVIKENNPQGLCILEKYNLLELVEKVKKPDLRSISRKITQEDGSIYDMTKNHIKSWAKYVKTKGCVLQSDIEFRVEALGVIRIAIKLVKRFELTDVQILSCLLALLAKGEDKGLLQQVVTGAGKSAIICVLAVIYALEGKTVDIVTSNPVLAQRDAKESQNIYELFELTASDNSDKSIYIRGPKQCYRKNIVYGDASQYQFDILRDNYSSLRTLCGRKMDIILVDEVDSMLIDDSTKIARLSSTAAGMDQLHIIYHLLWSWMLSLDERILVLNKIPHVVFGKLKHTDVGMELEFSSDNGDILKIQDLQMYIKNGNDLNGICKPIHETFDEFLTNHLQNLLKARLLDVTIKGYEVSLNDKIQIPVNLMDFVEQQIPRWVKNVINAFSMEENMHYVLADGIVKPVDFDSTGIIRSSTTWSNGLHQFLQIKHNLKMTSENFTTNFLSNMCFFKRYGSNILGFTGTLGSVKAREILCEVYNVDMMIIPEPYKKQYIQLPDIYVNSRKEWLSEIKDSVYHEIRKKRGVLVICEAIKDAEAIAQKLREGKKTATIKLYTMNNMNQENRIERISPEEIIVATNLAGRGTDVKADGIEQYGGLHICLTFLPSNQRVEDQAFGRTSRQGKCGTGQLIFMSSIIATNRTVPYRICRDEIESIAFDHFRNSEIKSIQMKDALFQKFCTLLRIIRNKLKEKRPFIGNLYNSINTFVTGNQAVYEKCIIFAIEERWAMFLNKVDTNIVSIGTAEEEFKRFELGILNDFDSDEVVKSPFYYTVIANDLLRERKYSEAKGFYDKVVEMDKHFSSGAYVGMAACRLYGNSSEADDECFKALALLDFESAVKILAVETGNLTAILTIIQHRTNNDWHCDLSKQVLVKLDLLNMCLNNIKHAQSVVKKSLRLISVSVSIPGIVPQQRRNKCEAECQVTFFGMTEKESLLKLNELKSKNFEGFEVTFDNLTVSNDCGPRDQAVKTVNSAGKLIRPSENYSGISIIVKDINPNILYSLVNLDKDFFNLSAEEALGTLNYEESILEKALLKSREVELKIVSNSGVNTEYNENILSAKKIVKEGSKSNQYNIKFKSYNKKVSDLYKTVHLELIVLDIASETAKQLINTSEYKTCSLHVIGPTEQLLKALENSDIKMVNIRNSNPKHKNEVSDVIQHEFASSRIQENEVEFMILLDLPNKSAIEILNSCSSCQFGLQFDELSIASALNVLRMCSCNIDFYIKNLSMKKAKELIPSIRSANIDFSLALETLNYAEASGIISNASRKSGEVELRQIKELSDHFLSEGRTIIELRELGDRGLEFLFEFSEREFVPWLSILSLSGVAMVQMLIGAILITTAFGDKAGMAIVNEGVADLFHAKRVYATRELNWSDYAIQKLVRLVISAKAVGWSGMKNAGLGIKTLCQEGAKECAEQAVTQLLINGRQVEGSVIQTGKSLRHLAVKYVAVSVAEVAGRECLRATIEYLSNGLMGSVRTILSENIQRGIVRTLTLDLKEILQKIYAIDTIRGTAILDRKFDQVVNTVLQDNGSILEELSEMFGRKILSYLPLSPKVKDIILILKSTVCGSKEINDITDKVAQVLKKKLTDYDRSHLSLEHLLIKYCGVHEDECPGIISELPPLSELLSGKNQSIDLGKHQNHYVEVSKFFKSLRSKMADGDLNNVRINILVKSMSDRITDQAVRILESRIISPWSNYGCNLAVQSAQWLQHNFVVNKTDDTEEFKRDQERVKSLRDKQCLGLQQLSEEENKFIKANELRNSYNTIENQIKYNAREFTASYSQLAILKAMQKDKVEVSALIQDFAKDIDKGKPAGLTEMFHFAKVNGIEMKIVDDSNYVPSDYEKITGVNVVVFTKGKTNKKEGYSSGSYTLLDSAGVPKNIRENKLNYTGYEILEHLTDKSANTLRSEISLEMSANPERFHKAIAAEEWVNLYRPQESNSILFRA